jgi:DNA-binding NtrC family response regulator
MDDGRKILIVDDESSLRKVLGDLLRLRGYTPYPVATGAEAVAAAKETQHDAAIVDLGLGEEEMTGIDVIKEIRSCSPKTQCIVLTGMPSQESAIQAMNLGAYAYLRKPFNVAELLQTIAKALEVAGASQPPSPAKRRPVVDRAKQEQQKFAAYARDELRSPLGSVLGLAQNIVETETLEDAQAFARILQTEAQGVVDSLDNYLQQIASGQVGNSGS